MQLLADDYGVPQRIPEMHIRFQAPRDRALYVWEQGQRLRFLHSPE